jgi:Undecaprenyl-phosphate galactose phosphotransferase WbaP
MAASSAIQRFHLPISIPLRPRLGGTLCLLAADTVTLVASVAISIGCKSLFTHISDWGPYLRLGPFLFVFLLAYALFGLYSGVALSPPQELRRATLSSTLIFVILATATMSLRGATKYVTWYLFLAIGLSIVLFPLLRAVVRGHFADEPWWGTPAVIFGAGPAAQGVVKTLRDQPGLGLKPVAVVDDNPLAPRSIHGVPVMSSSELADALPRTHSAYAVVAGVPSGPGVPGSSILATIEKHGLCFSRILMIPNLADFCTLWVDAKNVGGMLGLEVCQQAFVPEHQWPKRTLDLLLTVAGSLVVLPLIAAIALWIKIDSPGPVFYGNQRIGQDGKVFCAWKFRSMVQDADRVLDRYLSENPRFREEWERDQKLRQDPRITRVGRVLRRASLDELPQLWNVVKGEMSLVGPRPVPPGEVAKYGTRLDLYKKVKSGLTGLWQISGRNDTTYDERVKLNTFYIRNWSVWLDFYILFRTIETVIFGKGAY